MTVFELEESLMGAGAQAQVEVSLTLEGVTVELPIVTVRPFPRNVELVVNTESEAFQQLLWRAVDLEMEHSDAFEAAVSEATSAEIRQLEGEVEELITSLEKLEGAATILSNHDRIKQPTRSAGDWSRLHNAIDDARRTLARLAGEVKK